MIPRVTVVVIVASVCISCILEFRSLSLDLISSSRAAVVLIATLS